MIWISIAASAYLLAGAAFGAFLTRQLPKRHELRSRYAEISALTGVHPNVLATIDALDGSRRRSE